MTTSRQTPIQIESEEFRKIGHTLVDRIAGFLAAINDKPVTTGESPGEIQRLLGSTTLPAHGTPIAEIFTRASDLMLGHSLLNGHPRFFGFITSSPTPIGMLADLLASSVNPNVGANILSPMATAIERQTVQWLSEFIGVGPGYGGLLVSGGNMANLTAFLAARTAKAPKSLKKEGLRNLSGDLMVYCSKSTHTWIEKAAALFGHGLNAIQWIPTLADNRMDNSILERTIQEDRKNGKIPFMVVGTAGDVSTGVVDDLSGIASICKAHDLWFHIDGAYGMPAAAVPELRALFEGITAADSIALDPHKWLYAPLEAGCTLLKNPQHLIDTFSSHPAYYNFDSNEEDPGVNFYEYGLQNSRGFRALKVWMALQQAGRDGYVGMIRQDVALSRLLFELAEKHPELEAVTQNLSITTLRYVPEGDYTLQYLNTLNEALVNDLQKGGEAFLSNAVVEDKYCLRACIVNFRTTEKDIEETAEIIAREGRKVHQKLKAKGV